MPYSEFKFGPLKRVSTNLTTGSVVTETTPYHEIYLETSRSNTVRRVRPADPFASGTAYTAYTRTSEDRRYIRPPNMLPGWRVLQPAHYDMSYGWHSVSADWTAVESRLRAKIKDQNVNLAQNVAEYRQASSMFKGLVSDIVQTFRSLRSGRAFSEFVRILQRPKSKNELAIANRWLQYQYGLKPLMSDLYGTSDALAKRIRDGMYLHVRSKLNIGLNGTQTSGDGLKLVWRWDTELRGVARYKISDPSMKMLSQFGITNPLLLAWELIPYSFVVDWLFPVGNFLSSLDALNGTSDLRVITAATEVHTWSHQGKYGGGTPNIFTGLRYTRNAPKTTLALPKLGYKPSSSLTAVLNGLALLTQLRHR